MHDFRHVAVVALIASFANVANAAETFSPTITVPAPTVAVSRPVAASPNIAEKLATAAPKFDPLPAVIKPAEPAPDLREIDKPRNGIIRLPNFVVREEKAPAIRDLKERDILTPKGRLDLVMKRHPGLHIGNLFGLNDGVALMMAEEEERLERQRESYDLVSLLPKADAKKAKAMVDEQFARKSFGGAR